MANELTYGSADDISHAPEASPEQQQPSESPLDEASEDESMQKQLRAKRITCYKKLFIASIIVGFIIFVIIDTTTTGYLKSGITSFLRWIQRHAAAGFFAFMAVYFIATVLFVPGSILTFGAGFVFAHEFGLGIGVLLGVVSVFFGAYSGATAGFLIARFVLREWVQNFAKKYAIFEALEAALAEKGFRIMTLIRLSPIIPFSATNYIAGITSLSFRDYEMALFFILPGTILYVFLGASAGSLTASASSGDLNFRITIPVIVVGVILGVLAVGLTSYYAKKELNRVLEKRRLEQEGQQVGDEEAQEVEEQPHADVETEETVNDETQDVDKRLPQTERIDEDEEEPVQERFLDVALGDEDASDA